MWGYGPNGMMGYGGWGSMGWMMLFNGLFWLVILGTIIVALGWLARSPWRAGDHPAPRQRISPGIDILEERYARGEINRDEFLQKKRDLLGHGMSD